MSSKVVEANAKIHSLAMAVAVSPVPSLARQDCTPVEARSSCLSMMN